MPDATYKAFLDHGKVGKAIGQDIEDARNIIGQLNEVGIDINDICAKLLGDGVIAFENSFESLLKSIEEKKNNLCSFGSKI